MQGEALKALAVTTNRASRDAAPSAAFTLTSFQGFLYLCQADDVVDGHGTRLRGQPGPSEGTHGASHGSGRFFEREMVGALLIASLGSRQARKWQLMGLG